MPTGMPFSGPDTLLDVHPGAVSDETSGLDGSKPMAVGFSGPPGSFRATDAAATAAYVAAPAGYPSCRPPEAAFSPVTSADPTLGAWRQAPESRPSQAARWPSAWPRAGAVDGGRSGHQGHTHGHSRTPPTPLRGDGPLQLLEKSGGHFQRRESLNKGHVLRSQHNVESSPSSCWRSCSCYKAWCRDDLLPLSLLVSRIESPHCDQTVFENLYQ